MQAIVFLVLPGSPDETGCSLIPLHWDAPRAPNAGSVAAAKSARTISDPHGFPFSARFQDSLDNDVSLDGLHSRRTWL